MKLRLPSKLCSLLMSAFVSLTLASGVSSATDGFSINFSNGETGKLTGDVLAGVIPTAGKNWTNVVTSPGTTQITTSNAG
ncbi:MAG: hypothetical protein RRY13_08770, partial [Akkermansia sp.]